MSYVALYRKYRPVNFDELVGQNHISNILRKQIVNNKVSHAYIFSGSRGTGKTTTAKIFSRAVNCLNPKDGNPCNECEACRSILNDDTTDVVELDAASNNSVENIRSIRQEVMYATTNLKYKVYIIDEAHMLSTSAFNALLKTLEEPPQNVIFILATTEEHKLLPTILSRCIRFEFKKISINDVVNRIKYVLNDLNLTYDEEAITYVAKLCDGGMRDALSILERCIDDNNSKITLEKIQNIVGISDKSVLEDLANSILNYDLTGANSLVDKVLETGKDVRYITAELLGIYMDMILKADNRLRLSYIIKEMSKLDALLRLAVNSNIIFKAKIIELCTKYEYDSEEELLEKIKKLELRIEKLESGKLVMQNISIDKDINNDVKEKKESEIIKKEEKATSNLKETKQVKGDFKDFDKFRNILVQRDNLQLYSALASVKAMLESNNLIFNTNNNFAYTILNKDENIQILRNLTSELLGDEYLLKIEYNNAKMVKENSFEAQMLNSDVPFTKID